MLELPWTGLSKGALGLHPGIAVATTELYPKEFLYSGPARLGTRGDHCDASVRVAWSPTPHLVVRLTGLGAGGGLRHMQADANQLTVKLLADDLVDLLVTPTRSQGNEVEAISADPFRWPNASAMMPNVLAFWVNAPSFGPTESICHPREGRGSDVWLGRTRWRIANYELVIDQAPDLSSRLRELRGNRGYGVTHGMLITKDGAGISGAEAERLLEALQLSVSLVVGRFVAPALLGRVTSCAGDASTAWAVPHVDPCEFTPFLWRGGSTETLHHLISAVASALLDDAKRASTRFLIQSYVSSNRGAFLEQRVMTNWAALEHLAWVRLVLEEAGVDADRMQGVADAVDGKKSDWRVRRLLEIARIPDRVPESLPALRGGSAGRAVGAVAKVRHQLTHPKTPGVVYGQEGLLKETWLLTQRWLGLALLHWVGYEGFVLDVTDQAAAATRVPWASP
jgi:hypothetical protein